MWNLIKPTRSVSLLVIHSSIGFSHHNIHLFSIFFFRVKFDRFFFLNQNCQLTPTKPKKIQYTNESVTYGILFSSNTWGSFIWIKKHGSRIFLTDQIWYRFEEKSQYHCVKTEKFQRDSNLLVISWEIENKKSCQS